MADQDQPHDDAPPPRIFPGWRCEECKRLLAHTSLTPGSIIEIKCPRCGVLNRKELPPEAA